MRLEQLTFTRFIAAISIVVFHYGTNIFPFNLDVFSFIFQQASIGVSYFFILSGFVMIIAYGQKKRIQFDNFIKRRVSRIYPVYLVAIILLMSFQLIMKIPIDSNGLIFNLTMIQAWIPGKALSFNSPAWSISVEMFFYISFPLLFNYFYTKIEIKKLFIYITLIFIISQCILHFVLGSSFYQGFPSKSHDFIFYSPLMHFNEFLVGNIFGLIFIRMGKSKNTDLQIIILLIVLIILLRFNYGINYHNGMLAFIFVPIIFLVSSNTGIISKILKNKHLVFLGEISYGVYILQVPVYNWVAMVLKYLNMNNLTFIFYASLAILIILSAISFKYIESPIRIRINSFQFINKPKSVDSQNFQ
ncbi:acyltransferase family protein [Peijinzhouia sedimentorum]